MPETLVISLAEDKAGDAAWTVIDEAGNRIGEVAYGPLSDATDAQTQRKVLVLVPGPLTVAAKATLPVRSASKMQQVAPFALEEHIAGDVTKMHFALGERDRDYKLRIVAMDRELMQTWVDALADAQINVSRMLPDSAGVPPTDGGVTVVVFAKECYIRGADDSLFFIHHDSLLTTLELLFESADEDATTASVEATPLTVFVDDRSGRAGEELLEAVNELYPHAEFRRAPNGLLPRLAAEAETSDWPNLLQGEFAPSANLAKHLAPWRLAAGLAASLFALGVVAKGVELVTYKSRYDNLQTQIQELYTSTLPNARPTTDPRRAFASRMRDPEVTAAKSDFLDGLSILASALPNNATLSTVSFSAGVMNLEVLAPDVATLDTLRAGVTAQPEWDAKLTQTRQEDDKIKGRLQLQRQSQ